MTPKKNKISPLSEWSVRATIVSKVPVLWIRITKCRLGTLSLPRQNLKIFRHLLYSDKNGQHKFLPIIEFTQLCSFNHLQWNSLNISTQWNWADDYCLQRKLLILLFFTGIAVKKLMIIFCWEWFWAKVLILLTEAGAVISWLKSETVMLQDLWGKY